MLIGVANLFADMTYEGGGSINGQFMGGLGAAAAAISITAGLGEFLGYSVRSLSGYLSDKTGKPWLITFIGYIIGLFAVPAMVFARNWQTAAMLICTERIGRAIRKPTVESMLSYTTRELGRGRVYALNTALDETGATLGPLMMAVVLFTRGTYRFGYSILLIPTILALITLTFSRIRFPLPSQFEKGEKSAARGRRFGRSYWFYMIAASCFAAGLLSYELVAYHLSKTHIVKDIWIPVFLASATAFGVIATLILGKYYDRVGLKVILIAVFLSSLFSPLVFLGGFWGAIFGMCFWGIGYSTQDTLLKSVVAGLMPEGKRSLAFGLFYTGYGGGWLIGSVGTGLLYEHSLIAVVIFAMLAQLASLPIFMFAERLRND